MAMAFSAHSSQRVAPAEIIETLEDAGISRERAIHIRWEGNMGDLRAPSALMALLAKGGYTRSTIVTEQQKQSDGQYGQTEPCDIFLHDLTPSNLELRCGR